MPYVTEWVPRDLFLEYNGVRIYLAYKDDEYDQPLEYWFALDAEEEDEFDIRNLPTFADGQDIEDILKAAIDAGLLKNPEAAS